MIDVANSIEAMRLIHEDEDGWWSRLDRVMEDFLLLLPFGALSFIALVYARAVVGQGNTWKGRWLVCSQPFLWVLHG